MPSVSPSGGGGSGSVSAPLTLTAPNDLNPILTLVAAAGTIADGNALFVIRDENGSNELYFDTDSLALVASAGAGAMSVIVTDRTGLGNQLELNSGSGIITTGPPLIVRAPTGAGLTLEGPHAAPADGATGAGSLTFWFDQTNGASALKLKGKTADGTVATATIPLT